MKYGAQTDGDSDSNPEQGCGCTGKSPRSQLVFLPKPGLSVEEPVPCWVTGQVEAAGRTVRRVSTELSVRDKLEHFRCRISAFRDDFRVKPGLYAAGDPDRNSDVLVSANYKLSFDALRSELKGLNVWILVLDTKGINVWCAAGKGTFGTDELIRQISLAGLDNLLDHKRIILPQLGAPGVSAHIIRQATGFRVFYGPVAAVDIRAYIAAGYIASKEMRTIRFPLLSRLVLTPMEIVPAMKKYPLYALIILLIFGLQPSGIIFKDAVSGGMPYLLMGLTAVVAGAFLTPVLLPYIPFRAFAVKGWIAGIIVISLSQLLISQSDIMFRIVALLFYPFMSSYIALQFTGSTTFTGMTGVKKELKIAIPVYIFITTVSVVAVLVYRLTQWGVL